MKHGRKLTVAQRKFVQMHGLDPAVWLVTKDTPELIELVHRFSDKTTRIIQKGDSHG